MRVTAKIDFLDFSEGRNRIAGEEFEVTDDRAAELKAANVIEVETEPQAAEETQEEEEE